MFEHSTAVLHTKYSLLMTHSLLLLAMSALLYSLVCSLCVITNDRTCKQCQPGKYTTTSMFLLLLKVPQQIGLIGTSAFTR